MQIFLCNLLLFACVSYSVKTKLQSVAKVFFPLLIVCKLLTVELQDALEKTGRSKEVLELGEVLDTGKRKRKILYNTS